MAALRYLLVLSAASLLCAQSGPFNNAPYEPLSDGDKVKLHLNRIYSPSGLAKSAFTAGLNQWINDPEEWGQGMKGYARRYGHRILVRSIENGIGMAVTTALGEDPRYFYSGERGAWRRVKHAVLSTIITRTDDGGRRFATWRFVGNYGAQYASIAWRPPSEHGAFRAFERGSISIGYEMAGNLFKEFWPDLKRKIRRR